MADSTLSETEQPNNDAAMEVEDAEKPDTETPVENHDAQKPIPEIKTEDHDAEQAKSEAAAGDQADEKPEAEAAAETKKEDHGAEKPKHEASKQKHKEADPVLLDNLLEMGMAKRLAKKALVATENKSLDAALAWIAELGAEEMEALGERSDNDSADSDEWEDCDEEDDDVCFKMVFVVNTELNMGVGKVASQVGHAALGLYRMLIRNKKRYEESLEEWEEFGERKITVKAKNAHELVELHKKAKSLGLPNYLVQDAGKTQIPIGSTTVLSIFGDEDTVNEVTGKLKLL